jgi:hypothetical protein
MGEATKNEVLISFEIQTQPTSSTLHFHRATTMATGDGFVSGQWQIRFFVSFFLDLGPDPLAAQSQWTECSFKSMQKMDEEEDVSKAKMSVHSSGCNRHHYKFQQHQLQVKKECGKGCGCAELW